MSDYIVNLDESNAQQILMEESRVRPVLVDVWADWCEPCKTLMPLLEKLADEYQGQFLLAKLNADEQSAISQQLGVRSLPTVLLIKDGQPVDGFVGAQPETRIREILDKYLPKPWDGLLQQAQQALEASDPERALPLLRQAYDESGQHYDIMVTYSQVLIELSRLDEAQRVLDGIRRADQDAAYEQLVAQLQLKREAALSPEVAALEQQLAADPGNFDLMLQLAVQYSSTGLYKEAMDALITILQQDREHADGKTRQTLLDTIASLGKGDPLAVEYQRKLYGLLY